jgi:hypothetical protein
MVLREQMEAGKVLFAEHLADGFREDLSRVRMADDGLVDPASVSSRVRALALGIAHHKWREDTKQEVPLRTIQQVYFDLVGSLFDETYGRMKEAGTTPARYARWFVSVPEQVKENVEIFDEFLGRVEAYWDDVGDAAWVHLEDARQLKAVFAGEPFPNSNPVSGAGLYVDTVILPDPFVRLAPVLRLEEPRKRIQEILRYALAVLEYRRVALAELEIPLVVVLPDRHHLDEHYRTAMHDLAGRDAAEHAGKVIGVQFSGADEAKAFFEGLQSVDEVMGALKRPDLVLFSDDWTDPMERQVARNWEEYGRPYGWSIGLSFWASFYNRYSQVIDLLRRSNELRGSPLIHAPTVWRWLQWKLESSAERSFPDLGKDAEVVRVLGSDADGRVTWLGNVPHDALIEIRQLGALDELRSIIARGIDELALSAPERFPATADRVVANLSEAIAGHRDAVRELRKRNLKFAGVDVGSFLVVGSIELAALAGGAPLYGALSTAAALSGYLPTAKDLKATSDALAREKERLQRGPVGILMRHVDLPRKSRHG